jgi:hypothetical protein
MDTDADASYSFKQYHRKSASESVEHTNRCTTHVFNSTCELTIVVAPLHALVDDMDGM